MGGSPTNELADLVGLSPDQGSGIGEPVRREHRCEAGDENHRRRTQSRPAARLVGFVFLMKNGTMTHPQPVSMSEVG